MSVKTVWFINLIITIIITLYLQHLICSKQSAHIFIKPNTSNLHAFSIFSTHISILLFAFTTIKEYYFTYICSTNDTYRSLQNIINNTILHTTIFLFSLAYIYSQINDKYGLIPYLLQYFLIGRILFGIGYFLGTTIGHQSFRSFGFGISFGIQIILMMEIVGPISLISIFS